MQDLMVLDPSTVQESPQSRAIAAQSRLTALARPRDIDAFRVSLLKDCSRRGFAEKARYHKPVGDGIEGPSIRFVEAALRHYGNVEQLVFTVADDERHRLLRCTLTDLEKNVHYQRDVVIEKIVERQNPGNRRIFQERQNSQGRSVFLVAATEDELSNKEGAIVSKTIRTLGLRILPPDVVDECMQKVIEVQRQGDARDPDEARKRLTDAYAQIGVSPTELRDYLGHPLEQVTPSELAQLRAIWAAIRDGHTTWGEEVAFKGQPSPPKASQAAPADPIAEPVTAGAAATSRATATTKPLAPVNRPPAPSTAPSTAEPDLFNPELDKDAREVDHIVARMYAHPERADEELGNIAKLSKVKRKGDDWSDYDWAKQRWTEIKASLETPK